jgi:hypothetical protein
MLALVVLCGTACQKKAETGARSQEPGEVTFTGTILRGSGTDQIRCKIFVVPIEPGGRVRADLQKAPQTETDSKGEFELKAASAGLKAMPQLTLFSICPGPDIVTTGTAGVLRNAKGEYLTLAGDKIPERGVISLGKIMLR